MVSKEAMKLALETCKGIINADWRKWDELASPEEFERWVKSRANHMATALREALASEAIEQPAQQEPVAWMVWGENNVPSITFSKPADKYIFDALYTTPYVATPRPQRKPLTDDQIADIYRKASEINFYLNFARAIEAAHGITE